MKLLLPLLAVGLIAGHGPARMNNSISDADFCFYENNKIEEVYGTDNNYKIDQVLNVSGIDWVFSNFAYGLDNPGHQPTVAHKGLYSNAVWNVDYNLNLIEKNYSGEKMVTIDDEESPFYSSVYKEEYRDLLSSRPNSGFMYNSVIMSKDYLPAKSIEDITLFTHYSTGTLGVIMMIQPEGENWKQLYTISDSHFMSHYAGTIDDLIDDGVSNNFSPAVEVKIDGGDFVRYFDSYCMYEDAKYNNIPDKPFKFAFVLQASANYQFDFILDGIVVNKKEAMKNYLNGILDKNVCGDGFNTNFLQSFKLMDKILSADDLGYLAGEYHDDGATSYYDTYKYLNDKINAEENSSSISNGLNLILNSSADSYKFIIISGLSLATIAVYYIILKRKSKHQN